MGRYKILEKPKYEYTLDLTKEEFIFILNNRGIPINENLTVDLEDVFAKKAFIINDEIWDGEDKEFIDRLIKLIIKYT